MIENKLSIDLIICTYNNASLLEKALAAIQRQKVTSNIDWQVLVVNNNCSDETPQTVENYAQNFPVPLKMMIETEQGLHHARFAGISETNGDWIAFVDDDCLIAEDFVEQIAEFSRNHPQCGIFGSKIILQWETDPPIYAARRKWAFAGKDHGGEPHRHTAIAGTGMVIKRRALEESGWLERRFLEDRTGANLVSGGDMEIGLRLSRVCEAWYNPACRIRHVIPARRLTRQYVRKVVTGLGGSRHNVAALQWKGSYFSWFFYSLIYSLGLAVYALTEAVSEFVSAPREADIPTAFAPIVGWWSAMWTMFRMNKTERRALLGSAL